MTMPHPLEQTVWQLVSYRDAAGELVTAWADGPATMQFQAGQVTGTTGCNRFFSAYTLTGDCLGDRARGQHSNGVLSRGAGRARIGNFSRALGRWRVMT
jgi:hypothetical protein